MRIAILCALCFIAPACASPRQVTIELEDVKLVYDCQRFEPQAKSFKDTRAVNWRSRASLKRAREEGDGVLLRALVAAHEAEDTRRLEELIVTEECRRSP